LDDCGPRVMASRLYLAGGRMASSSATNRYTSPAPRLMLACAMAAVAVLLMLTQFPQQDALGVAFVGVPVARPQHGLQAWQRSVARHAGEVLDADVVGEEEEPEEEEEAEAADADEGLNVVEEPDYDDKPSQAWYDRRKIDRHKVNSIFFDMFKKPKSFFPHKLQPGDTVRVFFLEPQPDPNANYIKLNKRRGYESAKPTDWTKTREIYFDGVILSFKGEYHARTMTLRSMMGKGNSAVGHEIKFPMHSPLVSRIEVLRRGYIGRNKNAYFLRGMVGSTRARIPVDQERTQMDKEYVVLSEKGLLDQIPDPEYPQQEWDRYPLPVWKQDQDEWDEEKYAPENVDQRTEYEKRILGAYRKRVKLQTK